MSKVIQIVNLKGIERANNVLSQTDPEKVKNVEVFQTQNGTEVIMTHLVDIEGAAKAADAQKIAQRVINDRDKIIEAANNKASKIISAAKDQIKELTAEADELKKEIKELTAAADAS